MNERLLITLYGPPGSGKGTVGKKLAEHFGCEHIDMGDVRRAMARDEGMTLEELETRARDDRRYDDALDDRVRALPQEHERMIICSRTAWFLLPQSIKVLLDCRPDIGAKRVALREGISADEAHRRIAEREAWNGKRYADFLGMTDYPPACERFDVVVDSSDMTPETVFEELVEKIEDMLHTKAS